MTLPVSRKKDGDPASDNPQNKLTNLYNYGLLRRIIATPNSHTFDQIRDI